MARMRKWKGDESSMKHLCMRKGKGRGKGKGRERERRGQGGGSRKMENK